MMPTTGKNFKNVHEVDDVTWNYPMKHFFLLATVPMITVKMSFTHFHINIFKETYSFINIWQAIS